jgi:DNA-binding FadR family transcriptional regulator
MATGNPLFAVIGGALRTSLKASIRAGLKNRANMDQIIATHQSIADAIAQKDEVRARKYMTIHFEEAFRFFNLRTVTPPDFSVATRSRASAR